MHMAQLISDVIYLFAGIAPTRLPVDPKKSNRALEFPALVTGLCQSYRVPVPPARSSHRDIVSMGTNQTGKRFYQVKVKSPNTTSIKELGRLMEPLQMQAFRRTYGKILELTIAEVSIEAIASLTQYYDQPLRCFTFGDFQLVPTIEEFEEILGCPLGGRKPYLSSGCLPSLSRIATVVKDSARGLDRVKQTRNGIAGLPQKYLEDRARGMANQGDWVPFMDVLALIIFGVVLFPNVDGLIDLAAIDAFLAYHHSKESPVVAVLADLFDTFDRRCEKSSARIICCLPALCVWLVSHLFQQDTRHPCPLLRYPMRGAPTEESMSPFLMRDLGAQNSKTIQRIHKAWETPLRKDQELRGIRNGIIGGYHEWLKVRIRGLDWLAKLKVVSEENFEAPEEDKEVQALKSELGKAKLTKEKFKLAATHVRKECAGLREENAITARALERETKRARKEEYGRNKFRGALWGSNSELKLRREERDRSRAHSMVLKEELIACSRSKRSLSQRLCETETNMLAIIAKYEEELGLATAHEHRIADEYAQVYAEKEARGRVIDSLHQEATMWMDRFALTLNGSQELPRLLAKAKAMADTYSTPEEIHGLLGYCQHMIDLMAHIIRNPDMSALKEQMASMMEAMLGMKQLMEKNAATAAAVSSAAEADPTPLATTHHPPSNIELPSETVAGIHPAPNDVRRSSTIPHRQSFGRGNSRKGLRTPFPEVYHGGAPGHSIEKCLALKYKVQHLMDAGWLTFQEDRPNVRTNPLANHGGGAVNAVESDRPHRSKPLRDVATPRRFIFEALQKGGVIPHSGCKEDSCLLHPGEMHDMETCLEVEELLQRMIDQGRLEVGIEGKEEQHICMQSTEGSGVVKPKPLVIYFTKSAASQKPGYPLMAKPVPFPYQDSHAVPWRYTPPEKKEEEVTDVSSLSAKVTNITGLSGVTRSGRVFAPPDLPVQPADVKGKGKVVEEQDGEAPHASNKDISAKGPPERRDGRKEVSLEEASEFLRIIQQSEFKVIEQLNKTPARVSLLELLMSSEPHRALLADMKRSIAGRKNSGQSSRWKQESEGNPPCHISRSFISAGPGDEGQVVAICEDDVPRTLDLVRPCPPDFQLGNWRVEERPGIYATSIIFDDESPEGMAPRKLASKRSRKDKAAEGTSSAPEYDSHRFRSVVHQQRFEAIKGWSFLRERRVQLRDDEYTDFQEEIGRRRWAPLVTPMAKFDPEIVLEFYANAWPTEEGVRDMRSWVRGQWIPFDADAISQLLGYPMVLEEGQECEYGQRRNRSDGFDEEAIAQLASWCTPS
ncbi:hypothetical protein GmHk_15G044410 [Glycine max]|nr:hypothetical protein GmHk_15G044410 [Glycine max]